MVALPAEHPEKDPYKKFELRQNGRDRRARAEQRAQYEFPDLASAYGYGRFGNFRDIDSESEVSYGSEYSYQPPSEIDHDSTRKYEY
jgi:hypothetical protein